MTGVFDAFFVVPVHLVRSDSKTTAGYPRDSACRVTGGKSLSKRDQPFHCAADLVGNQITMEDLLRRLGGSAPGPSVRKASNE